MFLFFIIPQCLIFSKENHEVFYTFTHVFDRGLESNNNYPSLYYKGQWDKASFTGAFQSGRDLTDITLAAEYFPFIFTGQNNSQKKLGCDFIYHVQYHELFCEQDFLLGTDFNWKTGSGFFLGTSFWLKYKYTDIYGIKDGITKFEPDISFTVAKDFSYGTRLGFTHAFHSLFRYNSATESVFTFFVRQDFSKGLSIKTEADFVFTDHLAAVNHLESSALRFALGVRF